MNGVILIATQRVGSTLACEDISSYTTMGHPREYFIPWALTDPEKEDWKARLEHIRKQASSEISDMWSVKIMANYLPMINLRLSYLYEEPLPDIETRDYSPLAKFLQEEKLLFLVRNDKIEQAVSRVLLQKKCGKAHYFRNKEKKKQLLPHIVCKDLMRKVYYYLFPQVNQVKEEILKIDNENNFARNILSRYSLNYKQITYEDYIRERKKSILDIANYCNAELTKNSRQIKDPTIKKHKNFVKRKWKTVCKKALI